MNRPLSFELSASRGFRRNIKLLFSHKNKMKNKFQDLFAAIVNGASILPHDRQIQQMAN